MSSLITSVNNAGSPQPIILDNEMLLTPQPNLISMMFADRRTIADRSGTILRKMQAKNLQPVTTPVAPGSQGAPPQVLTFNAFDTPINNYATSVYIDVFNLYTNQLPLAAEAGKRLMISLMQSEDAIGWTALSQNTTQYKCVSGGNGDDPTELSYNDSLTMSNTLNINNAMPTYRSEDGSLKFGSGPLQASYWCMISTALIPTLRANSQFLPVEKYSAPVYSKEEVGMMGGLRYVASTQAPVYSKLSGNNQIIYVGVFGGYQTYTDVHLEGMDKLLDWTPSNYTGPNMQQVLFTARNMFGTAIVQPTWVGSFLSTASISPVASAA